MIDILIKKAIEEIETKTFALTKQFLAVHDVVYVDSKPKVEGVIIKKEENDAVVYFAVKEEMFYLAVYFDLEPETSLRFIGTEPYNKIYFKATSEELSYSNLSSMTKLIPTSGWSKGDERKRGNSFYNFSLIKFEPNPEIQEFENKINNLLNFLEQDKEGIKLLSDKANVSIQVVTYFHNGTTRLGGHHLNKDIIKRLSDLNLQIDFDLYATGNKFL